MLDLQTLRENLSPIKNLGELEETFNIKGATRITLRMLTPEEELEAMLWSHEILKDIPEEDKDVVKSAQFFDRFRIATLSYAIKRVGDNVMTKYTFTGEVLENGTPVQKETYKILREEMSSWGRALIQRIFMKYGELLDKAEQRAKDAIHVSPVDLDSRIENLEEELQELKIQKEEQEREQEDVRSQYVAKASALPQEEIKRKESLTPEQKQEVIQRAVQESVGVHQEEETPQPPQEAPESMGEQYASQRVIPNQAPPPVRPQNPQEEFKGKRQVHQSFEDIESSIVSSDDPEAMKEAMAREYERKLREKQEQERIRSQRKRNTPPHRAAANLSHNIQQQPKHEYMGEIKDPRTGESVQTYRMPTQEITGKSQGISPKQGVPLDKGSRRPTNPNFKKPKR